MPEAILNVTKVMLSKMVKRRAQVLGDFTRGSLRLDENKEFGEFAGEMVWELTASLLRRRVVADRQLLAVHVPASWWQHWKASRSVRALKLLGASWGPSWYRRRWAVRYKTVSASCSFASYDNYPMADVQLPPDDFGYPVRWDEISMGDIINPTPFRARADIGSVRHGREYASRERLEGYLQRSLWPIDTGSSGATSAVPDIAKAMLNDMERLGIHLGGLVQLDALERKGF